MTDDLVKRLLIAADRADTVFDPDFASPWREAAACIEQQKKRNKELEAALRGAYKDCLNAVEKVKSDPFTELGVHHKGKWGDTTARDWMVAFAEDVEREIKARAALGENKDDASA